MNQKILKYFYIYISLIIFNYQFILTKDVIILQIHLKIKSKTLIKQISKEKNLLPSILLFLLDCVQDTSCEYP